MMTTPSHSCPDLTHVCDLAVTVGVPLTAGESQSGERRLVPITGGTITGARLAGRILPGGSDVQIIRQDGTADLAARYFIETHDGASIYVENIGLRSGPPDIMARLKRGEPVEPSQVYFRSTPRFETTAPAYQWLTRRLFICSGTRLPDKVLLSVFEVG